MEVPDFLLGGYSGITGAGQFSQQKQMAGEHLAIDDLFDFPNEDATLMTDGFLDNVAANSMDSSSSVTAVDSCNSSLSGGDNHFSHSLDGSHLSGEFCLPYDDNLAELEWLSNFVEDSFTAKETELPAANFTSCMANADTIKLQPSHLTPFSSGMLSSIPFKTCKTEPFDHQVENALPSKARSKRTARAAPCDWSTCLFHLPNPSDPDPPKTVTMGSSNPDSSGRKCLHCATEKTPQWRTGPMGPKTLCNACGVRYKSGRLVPEYRPASSPTFVPAKHSNSHRKVLELQRARAVAQQHQHQHQYQQQQQQQQFISQSSIFGVSNGGDDYLIHSQGGPQFRRLI